MSETLQAYSEWKEWASGDFGKVSRRAARYYDWHVDRAVGERSNLKVLEIGFGNGGFLGHCLQRGWEASAIEIDPLLRERATKAGLEVFGRIDEVPTDRRFDLIALFDVLEHVPTSELPVLVRSLRERLATEGAIMLRVPNGDSPFGRRNQHGDLTHVVAFGEFKLRQLAQLCELKLVGLGESPWHSQQNAAINMSTLLRACVRGVIERVLGYAYFGRRIDLSVNLFAVLADASSARPELS